MFKGKYLLAISTLVGTIVGAGIFGLPYIVAKGGILLALFYFLLIPLVSFFMHSFFAEIILRTKEKCLLPGLANKYLGKRGKTIATVATTIGTIGALFAYVILCGSFFKILLSPFFDVSEKMCSVFAGLLLSLLVLFGIKTISKFELLASSLFFVVIGLIFFFVFPEIKLNNFNLFNLNEVFLPFGVAMFAFSGWSAIPAILSILKTPEERSKIGRVVIISLVLCFILYVLFSFIVVGVSGNLTTQKSFDGLVPFVGQKIVLIGAIFGLLACSTSFVTVAHYFKDTLSFDFNINPLIAFLIACGAPLVLVFMGILQFIEVIGLSGSVLGTVEGMLIIIIFRKAKVFGRRMPEFSLKVPSFVLIFLAVFLILGSISQLVYFF